MRDLWWFLYHSWFYLGCDKGSGRWKARFHYLRDVASTYGKFREFCKD